MISTPAVRGPASQNGGVYYLMTFLQSLQSHAVPHALEPAMLNITNLTSRFV